MTGLTRLQPFVRSAAEYAVQVMRHYTGVQPTVTSGFRTAKEQQQLYRNRSSNPNPVNAPGDSSHEYGLGFDSVVPRQWIPTWKYILEAVGFYVLEEATAVHANVPNWRNYVRGR